MITCFLSRSGLCHGDGGDVASHKEGVQDTSIIGEKINGTRLRVKEAVLGLDRHCLNYTGAFRAGLLE